jgi:hypothetical protein
MAHHHHSPKWAKTEADESKSFSACMEIDTHLPFISRPSIIEHSADSEGSGQSQEKVFDIIKKTFSFLLAAISERGFMI